MRFNLRLQDFQTGFRHLLLKNEQLYFDIMQGLKAARFMPIKFGHDDEKHDEVDMSPHVHLQTRKRG